MPNEMKIIFEKPVVAPQAIATDNQLSEKSQSTLVHKESGICFALDFSKNNGIMRRRRDERRKVYEKQRKEKRKQIQEQKARNLKAIRYSKEMRNRENIRKSALKHQVEAFLTPGIEDDKFIESALNPESRFDKLIYNVNPSDATDEFDDIFDKISHN